MTDQAGIRPPGAPELAPEVIEHWREQLLRELAPATQGLRLNSLGLLRARPRIVAAVIILFSAAGAGTALAIESGTVFGGDSPNQIGSRVAVAAGQDWSVNAWSSSRGICLDIVVAGETHARGCGFPVRGTPPDTEFQQPPPTHALSALSYNHPEDGHLYLAGVAASDVDQIQLALSSGSVVRPRLRVAPDLLESKLLFFAARIPRAPSNREVLTITEGRAYEGDRLIDRIVFPDPAELPVR